MMENIISEVRSVPGGLVIMYASEKARSDHQRRLICRGAAILPVGQKAIQICDLDGVRVKGDSSFSVPTAHLDKFLVLFEGLVEARQKIDLSENYTELRWRKDSSLYIWPAAAGRLSEEYYFGFNPLQRIADWYSRVIRSLGLI